MPYAHTEVMDQVVYMIYKFIKSHYLLAIHNQLLRLLFMTLIGISIILRLHVLCKVVLLVLKLILLVVDVHN
jgi:hypothetical protein